MLFFIGLGLGDAKDITVKGLEIVKNCKRVYLEAYTSILTVGKESLVWTVNLMIHSLVGLYLVSAFLYVMTLEVN